MSAYDIDAPDILKIIYPEGITELLMKDSPTLGMLGKVDCLYGDGKQMNWQMDTGSGDAVTVAEGEADEGPSTHKRPLITRAKEYATAKVMREALMAAESKGAVADLWRLTTDNAVKNMRYSMSISLWRDGTGVRGFLKASGAGGGTPTVTLATPNDVKLFRSGMYVQACDPANLASAGLRNSGAKIKITGRNLNNGTLTAGGNWTSTIAALVDGDALLRAGDIGAVCIGFKQWIPKTAPANGSAIGGTVGGVDRSGLGEQAYGHRPAAVGSNLLSIGMDCASYLHDATGASPDVWYVNGRDFNGIAKELTTYEKINIPAQGFEGKKVGNVGYTAIRFKGPNGDVDLVADPYIERGDSWMGNRETAEIWTRGELIQHITLGTGEKGGYMVVGSDAIGIRFGGFYNLAIEEPYQWAYQNLPTS
jgi:hypothetical protein